MSAPGATGSGLSVLVTETSAVGGGAATVVSALSLGPPSSGSEVSDEAVAVLVMTVPGATPEPTWTVMKKSEVPTGSESIEQETVPPDPTGGVVQLQAGSGVRARNVTSAGSVSSRLTNSAVSGPALVRRIS